MATSPKLAKSAASGFPWNRLWFLLGALIVYRIGTHIPVPGVDAERLADYVSKNQNGLLGMFNMFSGGALLKAAVFALGITPYISASIVMQLMSIVSPQLEALKKEGESGRRKITQYTRYGTLVLAAVQSMGIVAYLEAQPGLVFEPGIAFKITTLVTLTTGTMFLMWLGEQITERGLGNGISIIIFAGIAAGLPNALSNLFGLVSQGSMSAISAILICVIVLGVTWAVVFVERGQRKVLLQYAKRQVGNKIYAAQTSHLPLKLNMAGVIPPIFASSIILFPSTLVSMLAAKDTTNPVVRFIRDAAQTLAPGEPIHAVFLAVAIVFFCFFYTALVFNSKEVAENLKKSGALVPGIRPGEQTARYIDKILMRLTLVGAVYITLVCLVPEFLQARWKVPFYFGGTSLLIIVVVTMDFMAQVQNYVLSHQYPTLFNKGGAKDSVPKLR